MIEYFHNNDLFFKNFLWSFRATIFMQLEYLNSYHITFLKIDFQDNFPKNARLSKLIM